MKKVFLILLLTNSACSVTDFNHKTRENIKANNIELDKVQFYLTDKIVLSHVLEKNNTGIEDGKIQLNKQVTRENIIFNSGTKGVFVGEYNNAIIVKFEDGDDKKKGLKFELNNDSGEYRLKFNGIFLSYDSELYDVKNGKGATLYIKKSQYSKYRNESRKVKGISVK